MMISIATVSAAVEPKQVPRLHDDLGDTRSAVPACCRKFDTVVSVGLGSATNSETKAVVPVSRTSPEYATWMTPFSADHDVRNVTSRESPSSDRRILGAGAVISTVTPPRPPPEVARAHGKEVFSRCKRRRPRTDGYERRHTDVACGSQSPTGGRIRSDVPSSASVRAPNDVRRDQNDQVLLELLLPFLTLKEAADERQIRQERDAGHGLRALRLGQAHR